MRILIFAVLKNQRNHKLLSMYVKMHDIEFAVIGDFEILKYPFTIPL